MCLCISADILASVLILLVIQTFPQSLQSLGAALISMENQLVRTAGVVLSTTVETAIHAESQSQQARDTCASGICFPHVLRATRQLNTGMAALALMLIMCTLYGVRHIKGGKWDQVSSQKLLACCYGWHVLQKNHLKFCNRYSENRIQYIRQGIFCAESTYILLSLLSDQTPLPLVHCSLL